VTAQSFITVPAFRTVKSREQKLLNILNNNSNCCIYYTVINIREICIEIKKLLPAELYKAQIHQAQTQKATFI
jgi:hypothetical protein